MTPKRTILLTANILFADIFTINRICYLYCWFIQCLYIRFCCFIWCYLNARSVYTYAWRKLCILLRTRPQHCHLHDGHFHNTLQQIKITLQSQYSLKVAVYLIHKVLISHDLQMNDQVLPKVVISKAIQWNHGLTEKADQ